jgi:methionyl-tRNA synthetase
VSSFYITTPIYYVNSDLHLGHAYTTVLADVFTRYHKLAGDDCRFLTGTDEHGQKVLEAATKLGVDTRAHCDEMSRRYKVLWEKLDIRYDRFIRTTDADHVAFVTQCLQRLHDEGHLYTQDYEGWYDVKSERYFTEKDLVDGKSPDGNEVVKLREKNWFFRMSAFQDWLIDHIQSNPEFIQPEHRRNEVLGFLRQPLQDLCISRPKTRMGWGIELPFDTDYVCYVWVDALLNYVTGAGDCWPASLHLIGKDILTTHCVYWPTLLKALGLEMPKTLLIHGWWLVDNQKMSKSEGNVVNPLSLIDHIGVDAFRFFLIREMVPWNDCSFTFESIVKRLNTDLANDLGNLLSRVTNLASKNLTNQLPAPDKGLTDLKAFFIEHLAGWREQLAANNLYGLLESVFSMIREANREMEQHAPWKLIKQDSVAAAGMLAETAEAIRLAALLLEPVMPGLSASILARLGTEDAREIAWCDTRAFKVSHGDPVFPRIDLKTFMEALEPARPAEKEQAAKPEEDSIAFEDFAKTRLLAARILEAAPVEGADRLLKLKVDAGEAEPRQIIAGIAPSYTAEELPGTMVCLVANLKPAKIHGVISQGMLLASKDGKRLVLVNPGDVTPGSSIG